MQLDDRSLLLWVARSDVLKCSELPGTPVTTVPDTPGEVLSLSGLVGRRRLTFLTKGVIRQSGYVRGTEEIILQEDFEAPGRAPVLGLRRSTSMLYSTSLRRRSRRATIAVSSSGVLPTRERRGRAAPRAAADPAKISS